VFALFRTPGFTAWATVVVSDSPVAGGIAWCGKHRVRRASQVNPVWLLVVNCFEGIFEVARVDLTRVDEVKSNDGASALRNRFSIGTARSLTKEKQK